MGRGPSRQPPGIPVSTRPTRVSTGARNSTEARMAAAGPAAPSGAAAVYTPGTYTGTAAGMGEVKVTMTFTETAITDVVVDCSAETADIGGVAAADLQEALLAAQNAEIDGVAGATITSNAVKQAAASSSVSVAPTLGYRSV